MKKGELESTALSVLFEKLYKLWGSTETLYQKYLQLILLLCDDDKNTYSFQVSQNSNVISSTDLWSVLKSFR